MKKYTALVLALMMVFTLCACSESSDTLPSDEKLSNEYADADDLEGALEGMAQIVNPINEITEPEMEVCIGIPLRVPFGAYEAIWTTIAGDVMIGQVDFMYDGVPYCYRAQKTDKFEDISGVYISSGSMTKIDYDSIPALTVNVDENGSMGTATWYADGYSYSISMGMGASSELLSAMYGLITA